MRINKCVNKFTFKISKKKKTLQKISPDSLLSVYCYIFPSAL